MARMGIRRVALAFTAAALFLGAGSLTASAQENLGAVVTIGGGSAGVGGGNTVVLAPGVTISGGEVTNSTGIGVLSGGGSSIGASTGGDDSAAIVE